MNQQSTLLTSGIRDNHSRGTVADFLRSNLYSDSLLLLVFYQKRGEFYAENI